MRFTFLILSLFLFSCTKELKYTKESLLAKAQAVDPSVTVILPRTMNEGVNCADYPDGCQSAHIVKIKNLEMIAVEFMDTDQAIFAAKKIRGYYSRNWLFDDVTNEPILEKFVTEHLEAKKP